jgi:hypothetical protein
MLKSATVNANLLQNPTRLASLSEPVTTKLRLTAALQAAPEARRQPIGTFLTAAGLVDEAGIQRVLLAQDKDPAARLGGLLVAAGEITEDELYRALSEQLGVPYVRLGEFDVEAAALACIPPDVARADHVLPLMLHAGKLVIGGLPCDSAHRGRSNLRSRAQPILSRQLRRITR